MNLNPDSQSSFCKAQSASRARTRWQPYNAIQPTPFCTQSSLSTPLQHDSLVQSHSQPNLQPPLPLNRTHSTPASLQKEVSPDNLKALALVLVDQTVASLSEIWQLREIPRVFRTTGLSLHTSTDPPDAIQRSKALNGQLPSPTSPAAQSTCTSQSSAPVPIKPFVHEVLRRSRTSTSVLQIALCYVEAIRSKIPGLVHKHQVLIEGHSSSGYATDASAISTMSRCASPGPGDTVRVSDEDEFTGGFLSASAFGSSTLEPSPSPLLCPRRTFLAALILASKFTQDKTYSNRAWAKLCGLPAREISRAEHALGEALDWRLWVGKKPVNSIHASPPPPTVRPVGRYQSDPAITTCVPSHSKNTINCSALRRATTLPSLSLADTSEANTIDDSTWYTSDSDTASSSNTSVMPSVDAYTSSTGSPSLPSLSNSPSSTESISSEDRTQAMSTFLDDTTIASHESPYPWPDLHATAKIAKSLAEQRDDFVTLIWPSCYAPHELPSVNMSITVE